MTAPDVYRRARSALFERGWHQGDYLGPDGSVCLFGALCVAVGDEEMKITGAAIEASHLIHAVADIRVGIGPWNDYPGRTFDEVVDVLDRAEKLAEQQQALAP